MLASIKSFNTFKEVDIATLSDDQKRHIIPCSWVIVEKGTQGNIKTKAIDQEGNIVMVNPRGYYLRKNFTKEIFSEMIT